MGHSAIESGQAEPTAAEPLKRTPFFEMHRALGAKLVPFAGYEMPVQYPDGIMAEHRWTREHAGVFDVSHMGPAFLVLREISGDPDADHARIATIAERLVPGDILGLKPGQLRYTMLLNDEGGMRVAGPLRRLVHEDVGRARPP